MRAAAGALLAAIVFLSVGPLQAAGLLTVSDGFLIDPATQAGLGRGHAMPGAGAWIAFGQCRLWGMAELPVRDLAGGLESRVGGGYASGAATWSRTGRGSIIADEWRVALGWRRDWTWRLEADAARQVIGEEPHRRRPAAGLYLGRRLALGGEAAVDLRVRVWYLGGEHGGRVPRTLARAAVVARGVALVLQLDRIDSGRPRPAAEFAANASAPVTLGVRWDAASASLGPTLAVGKGSWLLRSVHTLHPVLGVTHRFEFCAGAAHAGGR